MSDSGIIIAIATPDDAPAIYDVQRQTWLATYPNTKHAVTKKDIESRFPPDSNEAIERKRARLIEASPNAREWVAKAGGSIIGWAVALKKETTNEVGALYVLPPYQGKKIGVQLMSTALEWLGPEKDIALGVAAYNDKAIAFYESWGFKSVGLDPDNDSILPNGKRIPTLAMILSPQK